MKYFLIIVLLCAVIITAGCVSENNEKNSTPTQTIPSTTPQVIHNVMTDRDGVIEYIKPEKINKPEDLHIGDLIQRSADDLRCEKNHAYIIKTISSQNNHYVIQDIAKGQIVPGPEFKVVDYGKWFGIQPQSSRSITFGALMRDYPYIIGHASGPLPQIQYVYIK